MLVKQIIFCRARWAEVIAKSVSWDEVIKFIISPWGHCTDSTVLHLGVRVLRTLHWQHSATSRGQYLIGLRWKYWKDAKEKQTYKSKYQNYGIVPPLSLPLWPGQEAGKPFFLSLWQEEDPGPEWTNAIRRMLTCDGVNKARDCSKPCCSPPHYNSLYLLSEWTADLEQTHSITMYNKLVKVTTRGFQIGELPRKPLLHYRSYILL